MAKRLTPFEFKERANQVHNNKYNYDKIKHVYSSDKVIITCLVHGDFEQRPSSHLQGNGCPICGREMTTIKQSSNTADFITKAKEKHGDRYSYEKVNYIKSDTKVIITCPEHNDFEQRPNDHLQGQGCTKCGNKSMRNNLRMTKEKFMQEANSKHNNKYHYTKTTYINARTKITITCPIHGDFEQMPSNHLQGQGCPKCGNEEIRKQRSSNTADFIAKAKEKHGDNKYSYDKVNYINSNTKVTITCPEHGDFEQTPPNHLQTQGCPKCGNEEIRKKLSSNASDFIAKAQEKHGDKYGYDKVNYIRANTKVTITCPEHGDFEQAPGNHLQGQGCPKCSGNAKLNTADFITKAKKKHGDKYSYEKVNYINNNTKVTITCPEHGDFEQTPSHHLQGQGCPKCGNEEIRKKLSSKGANFIIKAQKEHSNKYNYNKINYIGALTKVIITCSEHGDFKQTPSSHLQGQGCPKCSGNAKLNTADFITKAKKKHGDKYGYDKVNYIRANTKVTITCPEHGDFEQAPGNHLQGQGCQKCGGKTKSNTADFITKAEDRHNHKYSYNKVNYINNSAKITITCPIHGDFEQMPNNHLQGQGCPKCSNEEIRKQLSSNIADFITKTKEIHGNRYSYEKVNYINARTKVIITCPYHGDFKQIPINHLKGSGCSRCNISKGEHLVEEVLKKLNIKYEHQYGFDDLKYKGKLLYDFAIFIDSQIALIEFHGVQHYKKISFSKELSDKQHSENTERDTLKEDYAKKNNIPLLIIPYTEIDNVEQKITEFVNDKL